MGWIPSERVLTSTSRMQHPITIQYSKCILFHDVKTNSLSTCITSYILQYSYICIWTPWINVWYLMLLFYINSEKLVWKLYLNFCKLHWKLTCKLCKNSFPVEFHKTAFLETLLGKLMVKIYLKIKFVNWNFSFL